MFIWACLNSTLSDNLRGLINHYPVWLIVATFRYTNLQFVIRSLVGRRPWERAPSPRFPDCCNFLPLNILFNQIEMKLSRSVCRLIGVAVEVAVGGLGQGDRYMPPGGGRWWPSGGSRPPPAPDPTRGVGLGRKRSVFTLSDVLCQVPLARWPLVIWQPDLQPCRKWPLPHRQEMDNDS